MMATAKTRIIGGAVLFLIAVLILPVALASNDARRAVARSTIEFSNNFFKVVANATDHQRNLITSPLSAQMVLAMAAFGAGGTTATQMRSTLLIPAGDNRFSLSGYKSLIETLNATTGVTLRLANKMYTANQFSTKAAYKQLTAEHFLSESQEVDFNNPLAAATTINSWCMEQTNNRIKNVIAPDSLAPDTMLVLVNAVYFKGTWVTEFRKRSTRNRPFHLDAQSIKNVPTMWVGRKFHYGDLPRQVDARFIELPYKNLEVSMVIILPNQIDGLQRVKDNLHHVNLTESLSQAEPREVSLYLPKFRIEFTTDLKETLAQMGMTTMFQDGADFSGIADVPLKVSKVVQKAFIEVNEEGSEAAAVTVAIARPMMLDPSLPRIELMRVDRPFLYMIVHRALDSPIFIGQILDPSSV